MQVGFRISPVTLEEHSGTFECVARSRDGRTQTHYVTLHVLTQSSFVPPPHINASLAAHADVGSDFVLSCSVTVDFGVLVELTWTTPNADAVRHRRVRTSDQVARNLSMGGTHLKVVERVRSRYSICFTIWRRQNKFTAFQFAKPYSRRTPCRV